MASCVCLEACCCGVADPAGMPGGLKVVAAASLLQAAGAQLKAVGQDDTNALHFAAMKGQTEVRSATMLWSAG